MQQLMEVRYRQKWIFMCEYYLVRNTYLKYSACFSLILEVIPGLSNAYFGLWGSFFNGVFCLGTWLRENKNTEYLVRDDGPTGGRDEV